LKEITVRSEELCMWISDKYRGLGFDWRICHIS